MKRILFSLLSIIFFITCSAQSNNYSRWSFTAEYVSTFFFGDLAPKFEGIVPSAISDVNFGATAEYAFTPVWGLGVDFYHLPFSGRNQFTSFRTNLNNTDFIGTVNLTKWFYPNENALFTVNATLGVGFAAYSSKFRYPDPNTSPLEKTPHTILVSSIPISLLFEYNLSKTIALGFRMHYRSFAGDNLEGVPYLNYKGVTNDYIGGFTVNARYKLGATKKDHLRNICMDDYSPESNFNSLEKTYEEKDHRLDSLLNALAKEREDSDGDGVPNFRDMELNTPKNTPVDCCGKTIPAPRISNISVAAPIIETKEKVVSVAPIESKIVPILKVVPIVAKDVLTNRIVVYDVVPPVYFDFDKSNIDEKSRAIIAKVAARMKADKSITVEIRGFCDIAGSYDYNIKLSQQRADNVLKILVEEWDIPCIRVNASGKGKVMDPPSVYPGNRRCDFFFNK